MMFNPETQMIRITNKRKVIDKPNSIHGKTLKQTKKAKYLGVTIDNTLLEQPYRLNSKEGELNNCHSPPKLSSLPT